MDNGLLQSAIFTQKGSISVFKKYDKKLKTRNFTNGPIVGVFKDNRPLSKDPIGGQAMNVISLLVFADRFILSSVMKGVKGKDNA